MKKILLSTLVLSSLALAATTGYKMVIGGKPSSLTATTVNGKPYIPLETLKTLGIAYRLQGNTLTIGGGTGVTAGGANERVSLEGCLNESLFNGVWRIKAGKPVRILRDNATDYPGWGLTLEFRNGTGTTLNSTDAGVSGTGGGIQLAFADANTLSVDPLDVQKFTFANLPPGGAVTHQLKFFYPYPAPSEIKTPVKFLLEVDPKAIGDSTRAKGVAFSSANPSFRVRLDCTK